MTRRASAQDLDYGADGLYYCAGKPFSGILEHRSEGNWVEAEETYENGLLSGTKKEWRQDGSLIREAECALGARHGCCREWDEVGRLVADDFYEFGIRVFGQRWDSAGHVTEKFEIQDNSPGYHLLQSLRKSAGYCE